MFQHGKCTELARSRAQVHIFNKKEMQRNSGRPDPAQYTYIVHTKPRSKTCYLGSSHSNIVQSTQNQEAKPTQLGCKRVISYKFSSFGVDDQSSGIDDQSMTHRADDQSMTHRAAPDVILVEVLVKLT